MSDGKLIEQAVDEAIHNVIVSFEPGLPESYRTCTQALLALVHEIDSATTTPTLRNSLAARIRSQLAIMAFEIGDHPEASKLAAYVLELVTPADPDFTAMALIRIKSLHLAGKHEEEIEETLKYVESGAFQGNAMIHLVANLARNHPQRINWKDSLISQVKAYVIKSPSLSQRIEHAKVSTDKPEEYLMAVADISRKISLEETARALGKNSNNSVKAAPRSIDFIAPGNVEDPL